MRWLLIALLVSLGALLFAAAAVVRHIWLERGRRGEPSAPFEPAKGPDLKLKP